jgi:hypothetical protein
MIGVDIHNTAGMRNGKKSVQSVPLPFPVDIRRFTLYLNWQLRHYGLMIDSCYPKFI